MSNVNDFRFFELSAQDIISSFEWTKKEPTRVSDKNYRIFY